MTLSRSFTTYAIALTIVVAQLLCGCNAMTGTSSSGAITAAHHVDTPPAAMPCHGGSTDPSAPEDHGDNSVECTHCLTATAVVADAFVSATVTIEQPSWTPHLTSIVPRAPPVHTTRLDRPGWWRAPERDESLVAQHILLLI